MTQGALSAIKLPAVSDGDFREHERQVLRKLSILHRLNDGPISQGAQSEAYADSGATEKLPYLI